MRVFMTVLAVAGNFVATVTLMLSLSTAVSVGFTSAANATECDPRHYFCFPCRPGVIDTRCGKGCCLTLGATKPE
jgi:hypothetical protein